jgi:hypothetical protein
MGVWRQSVRRQSVRQSVSVERQNSRDELYQPVLQLPQMFNMGVRGTVTAGSMG